MGAKHAKEMRSDYIYLSDKNHSNGKIVTSDKPLINGKIINPIKIYKHDAAQYYKILKNKGFQFRGMYIYSIQPIGIVVQTKLPNIFACGKIRILKKQTIQEYINYAWFDFSKYSSIINNPNWLELLNGMEIPDEIKIVDSCLYLGDVEITLGEFNALQTEFNEIADKKDIAMFISKRGKYDKFAEFLVSYIRYESKSNHDDKIEKSDIYYIIRNGEKNEINPNDVQILFNKTYHAEPLLIINGSDFYWFYKNHDISRVNYRVTIGGFDDLIQKISKLIVKMDQVDVSRNMYIYLNYLDTKKMLENNNIEELKWARMLTMNYDDSESGENKEIQDQKYLTKIREYVENFPKETIENALIELKKIREAIKLNPKLYESAIDKFEKDDEIHEWYFSHGYFSSMYRESKIIEYIQKFGFPKKITRELSFETIDKCKIPANIYQCNQHRHTLDECIKLLRIDINYFEALSKSYNLEKYRVELINEFIDLYSGESKWSESIEILYDYYDRNNEYKKKKGHNMLPEETIKKIESFLVKTINWSD